MVDKRTSRLAASGGTPTAAELGVVGPALCDLPLQQHKVMFQPVHALHDLRVLRLRQGGKGNGQCNR